MCEIVHWIKPFNLCVFQIKPFASKPPERASTCPAPYGPTRFRDHRSERSATDKSMKLRWGQMESILQHAMELQQACRSAVRVTGLSVTKRDVSAERWFNTVLSTCYDVLHAAHDWFLLACTRSVTNVGHSIICHDQ